MRPLLLSVCALLIARPVAGQTVRYTDEEGREIVRRCKPTEWPKKLPPLSTVLDSATLFAVLDSAPDATVGEVLLSIVHRENAAPVARLLEPAAPGAFALRVVDQAGRNLRAITPGPNPAGALRVRVAIGALKTATVERSVFCPAEAQASAAPGPERMRVMIGPGDRIPQGRTIRIDAEMTIDEAGQVIDVKLLNSSGIRELDEAMVNDMRTRRYQPAMLDGLRLPSWIRNGGRRMQL